MRALGIIRRIDELGRIVIPKELRKKLNIHFGELLEISVGEENTLVIKKKKSLKEIEMFIKDMINKISLKVDKTILICDYDEVLCTTNNTIKKYFMPNWVDINEKSGVMEFNEDYFYECKPIIVNSDKIGMLFFFSKTETFGKLEESYLDLLSLFIEKYVEQ